MTVNCPKLYYLDEKPIFEEERQCAEAFVKGGKEAEVKVKMEFEEKRRVENSLSK